MRRVAAIVLLLAACGSSSADDRIVVSAASSLTIAFSEIESAFEAAYPGTDVVLNFAATSALREQILDGAGVDVFASADEANMRAVTTGGQPFTTNRLVIGVPAGNPDGVASLADLSGDRLIGRCIEGVPCGTAASALSGVEQLTFDTLEPNVRSLVAKLESGDLDAGLVYASDVASSHLLDGVDVGAAPVSYFVAALGTSPGASIFVEYLGSEPALRILKQHGFGS